VVCTLYFSNKTNQTEKVFDSEKCSSSRNGDEWILWPDVRPAKRYGRFATLRVEKENTTLIGKSPYAIYFKIAVSVWMEWMNDPEGFVIKILLGCS
jgi:hypothetical protein